MPHLGPPSAPLFHPLLHPVSLHLLAFWSIAPGFNLRVPSCPAPPTYHYLHHGHSPRGECGMCNSRAPTPTPTCASHVKERSLTNLQPLVALLPSPSAPCSSALQGVDCPLPTSDQALSQSSLNHKATPELSPPCCRRRGLSGPSRDTVRQQHPPPPTRVAQRTRRNETRTD